VVTNVLVPYHLDEQRPELEVPTTIEVTITRDLPPGNTWQRMAHLYEAVADTVAEATRRGDRPVVFSGDCTTSLGIVAGLQRAGVDPSIVWLDAHGDVQTPETTGSGYLGGMPLSLLTGHRPDLIATSLGLRPIPGDRVVLADARDLDPPESVYLARSGIRRHSVPELSAETVPAGPLYLHIDVDVVDSGELPGLLYPVPGGPGLSTLTEALDRIVATGRVVAVAVACTWHPTPEALARITPAITTLLSHLP
jgi:arginase